METKKHQKPTLRQRIAHALTDRKILHFRYDAHLRQQVYKRLNTLQKSLINRISAIGIEGLSAKKLDKLLTELQTEIAKTYQETTAYTQDELSGFLSFEASKISQLYNDEIGFDLFNDVPKERIKAIKNVAVIEGQPLEAWWNKQRADLAFKFEGIIRTGVAEGKQNGQLATEVRELMSVSRRTADTLVITAVAKVADTAHEALRDANLDILQGEEHLSTLDMRTSTVCQVRDGKRWDLDKKPIGHNIPYKRPPLHPRCRSILQLVTKSWEELGVQGMEEMPTSTRASMNGQVDERINYESWLHSKTHEEREQVLGKGKADLWERGVITFSDMLDQSGRPLTLKELYSKSSLAQEYNPMDVTKKYQQAVEIEPKITKAVTTIIASVDGEVAGLEYRLKSMDSLKRKIETEMMAGISEQQAIDNIKDVIRYTAIFSPENFVTQYREMQSALEKQGYKTIIVKNTWKDGAVYKGINTFITTLVKKDNVIFEMQYHTSESFALKNGELHQLYERFRDPNTEQEEKEKLYIEMQKLSAKLVTPKDIQKIKGVK